MGMFDRVIVLCQNCSEPVEFQTKAGPCNLFTYGLDEAPIDVLASLDGQSEQCPCGIRCTIRVVGHAWPEFKRAFNLPKKGKV